MTNETPLSDARATMSFAKGPLDVVSGPDMPARETSAENCRIEITPEMVEAGRGELELFNHDYESAEEAVVRIYCAMISRSPLWYARDKN